IQEPDDSVEKTCRRTVGVWRDGKPTYVTTPHTNGRHIDFLREKAVASIFPCSAANTNRQETSLTGASAPILPKLSEKPRCLAQHSLQDYTICQMCYAGKIASSAGPHSANHLLVRFIALMPICLLIWRCFLVSFTGGH